jgi:hypothetical protein
VFLHGAADLYEWIVLLALAHYADENGKAFPTIPQLAKRCHMSERKVQSCLQSLKKQNLLRIQYRANTSNSYYLNLKELECGAPYTLVNGTEIALNTTKNTTSNTNNTNGNHGSAPNAPDELNSPYGPDCWNLGCGKPARQGKRSCSDICEERMQETEKSIEKWGKEDYLGDYWKDK